MKTAPNRCVVLLLTSLPWQTARLARILVAHGTLKLTDFNHVGHTEMSEMLLDPQVKAIMMHT
jgi:hypothetical protein